MTIGSQVDFNTIELWLERLLKSTFIFDKPSIWNLVDMSPDPTRAYFWPAVNKKPVTRLWPRYFLTRAEELFLIGNFPN